MPGKLPNVLHSNKNLSEHFAQSTLNSFGFQQELSRSNRIFVFGFVTYIVAVRFFRKLFDKLRKVIDRQ
jgi:hypothetical protein